MCKHRVFARCQNWPNPRPDMNYLLSLLTLQPAADLPKHASFHISLIILLIYGPLLSFCWVSFFIGVHEVWTATRVWVKKVQLSSNVLDLSMYFFLNSNLINNYRTCFVCPFRNNGNNYAEGYNSVLILDTNALDNNIL